MNDDTSLTHRSRPDAERRQRSSTRAHGDPFAVLGPHEVDGGMRRARVPARRRQRVEVLRRATAGSSAQLQPHPSGRLLRAARCRRRTPYRLRIHWPDAVRRSRTPIASARCSANSICYLLGEGRHRDIGHALGAQPTTIDGVRGARFAVWAPNAQRVSRRRRLQHWDGRRHPMRLRHRAGVWELFVPRVGAGHALQVRDHRRATASRCR